MIEQPEAVVGGISVREWLTIEHRLAEAALIPRDHPELSASTCGANISRSIRKPCPSTTGIPSPPESSNRIRWPLMLAQGSLEATLSAPPQRARSQRRRARWTRRRCDGCNRQLGLPPSPGCTPPRSGRRAVGPRLEEQSAGGCSGGCFGGRAEDRRPELRASASRANRRRVGDRPGCSLRRGSSSVLGLRRGAGPRFVPGGVRLWDRACTHRQRRTRAGSACGRWVPIAAVRGAGDAAEAACRRQQHGPQRVSLSEPLSCRPPSRKRSCAAGARQP
jgi:hypothetical protein